jgi:NAD(P)-dependent dehydrogenase (short-subunit alcohol dehydrogenase family)
LADPKPAKAYSLQGKAAIITGAGGGICRAIAITFAQAGARVACLDINPKNAEESARLAEQGAIAIACDVSSESGTRAAVERAAQTFGRIDILLNGAAMSDPTATVLDLDLAAWNRIFATNLGGAFLMSRWVIPHMISAGGGSIIHIASQLGTVGTPGRVAYCSTKGALITMAKAMAADHAAQNIRVNTLSPGAVETDRMLLRFGSMDKARELLGSKHLMQRLGRPDEIAQAALFLASDASSFMTGSDLRVDGGYNAV